MRSGKVLHRVSQDETIDSCVLNAKFDQRVRPRTAIKSKVETGKYKNPKELEEMRLQGVKNGCQSDFYLYVESEHVQ
jgi:hypothetical protein